MSAPRKDIPPGFEPHSVSTLAARLGVTPAKAGQLYVFGAIRAAFSLHDAHIFRTSDLDGLRVQLGTSRASTPATPGDSMQREFRASFHVRRWWPRTA